MDQQPMNHENTVSLGRIAIAFSLISEFGRSSSMKIIQMLHPLQLSAVDTPQIESEVKIQQTELEGSGDRGDRTVDSLCAQNGKEVAVQHWSVDDVSAWLLQNVPFQSKRTEDFSHSFHCEGVDGLRLLTLQRQSQACAGMSDSEWISFNVARENLLAVHDKAMSAAASITTTPDASPARSSSQVSEGVSMSPHKLQDSSSLTITPTPKPGLLSSSFKYLSFPRHWWSSSTNKYEQNEAEVHALQEEVFSAEERESALRAKIDHLEEILRTAHLANYLYSRLRWTPLPGEPPADDVDVDDWLQRFLVIEGSTIFFYPQAADLSPQGAILLSEIVEVGQIPGYVRFQRDDAKWFGFQITTCDGLRFECATTLKLQMDLWVSTIQSAREKVCQAEDFAA